MKFIGTLAFLLSFSAFAQSMVKCEGKYENSEAVMLEQSLPDIARYDFDPNLTSTVMEYLLPRINETTNLKISVLNWNNSESIDLKGKFSDGSDFKVNFSSFSLKELFPGVKQAIQSIVPIKPEVKITLKEFVQIMSTTEISSLHTFYGLISTSGSVNDGPIQYFSCGIFFNGNAKR